MKRVNETNDGGRTVAGVDIGGTKVRFVIRSRCVTIYSHVVPYVAASNAEFLRLIVSGLEDLKVLAFKRGLTLDAIGMGCAGMVDRKRGVLRFSPNMPGIREIGLVRAVEDATGSPAFLENDVKCALFAEWTEGAATGARNVVMLSIGTGIGGALILNNRFYVGHHGYAGEIGHIPVVQRGCLCGCGKRGCLETVASGTAIERYVRESLDRGAASVMMREEALDAQHIAAFAQSGDRLAARAFRRAAQYLGRVVTILVDTLDLDMIVLGGGVAKSGLLLDEMKQYAAAHSLPLLFEGVAFAEARFQNDAGALGAALLAEKQLEGYSMYEV